MNEGLDFLTILDAAVFAADKHQGQDDYCRFLQSLHFFLL